MHVKRPLAFLLFCAIACAAASAAAQGIEFALAPLENKASISEDELALLTDAVHSAFLDGSTSAEVISGAGTCADDPACLQGLARQLGASKVVLGSVILFGGEFAAKLEVRDAQAGTVSAKAGTESFGELKGLLTAIKISAVKLKQTALQGTPSPIAPVVLQPTPAPAPATGWTQPRPATPPPTYKPTQQPASSFHPTGGLNVTSEPSGASVYIGDGLLVGRTPVTKNLEQGLYNLRIAHEDYQNETKWVTVFPGEYTKVHVTLKKTNVPVVLGVVALVPGVMLAGGGIIAAANEEKKTGAILAVTGGVLAATGTALIIWGAVAKKKKQKKKERRRGVTLLPAGDGFAGGYSLVF